MNGGANGKPENRGKAGGKCGKWLPMEKAGKWCIQSLYSIFKWRMLRIKIEIMHRISFSCPIKDVCPKKYFSQPKRF